MITEPLYIIILMVSALSEGIQCIIFEKINNWLHPKHLCYKNVTVDSCYACLRESIFSLIRQLNASTNVIAQNTLSSDGYTISELHQIWIMALSSSSPLFVHGVQ